MDELNCKNFHHSKCALNYINIKSVGYLSFSVELTRMVLAVPGLTHNIIRIVGLTRRVYFTRATATATHWYEGVLCKYPHRRAEKMIEKVLIYKVIID